MEQSAAPSQSQSDLSTDDIKAEFIDSTKYPICLQITDYYDF